MAVDSFYHKTKSVSRQFLPLFCGVCVLVTSPLGSVGDGSRSDRLAGFHGDLAREVFLYAGGKVTGAYLDLPAFACLAGNSFRVVDLCLCQDGSQAFCGESLFFSCHCVQYIVGRYLDLCRIGFYDELPALFCRDDRIFPDQLFCKCAGVDRIEVSPALLCLLIIQFFSVYPLQVDFFSLLLFFF